MTTPYLTPPVFSWPAAPGGKLHTYQAGGVVAQATYSDAAGVTPNTNPVTLDSLGSAVVRLAVGIAYHVVLKDATDTTTLWDADNIDNAYLTSSGVTAAIVGAVLYPQTAAEVTAGITPTYYFYPQGNVLRYGIVANSTGAAAANTTALKACLNATTGIRGSWVFPNLTGADVYYFSGVIPVRDGIRIDLQNCTLNFGGAAGAGDVNSGLFFALRDFTLENGSITCAIDTTLATNSGNAVMIGARGTDSSYFTVWDSLLPVPMGNVVLRNLRISMSNTGTHAAANAILMLGGLVNVLVENLVINGNSICVGGIYYEFGWATNPGGTAASQTSHAHNMTFRNVKVYGLKTAAVTDGYGIGLTGAYNCTVDGLYVNGAYNGFEYRSGEALFYNPWASVDDVGAKRSMTLRNIVCEAITSTGISLVGAEAASSGYLSGAGLTAAQQTDLMSFSIDGFAVGNGAGTGMFVSGPITARNGYLANTAGSGQLIISDECMQFEFENVRIVGSSAQGVRANFAGIGVWGTPRQKIGAFRNCIIAGNATFGLEFGANTRSVTISHCRIGYSSLYDAAAEAVQGIGVLCDAGCNGVVCDSNYVTTFGGANAYSITGTTSGGCNLINPLGTVTTAGAWEFDGCATATSTNLALKANIINTANKYFGKRCINSSTSKLFIAQGSADVSTWVSVDGATTITPV